MNHEGVDCLAWGIFKPLISQLGGMDASGEESGELVFGRGSLGTKKRCGNLASLGLSSPLK